MIDNITISICVPAFNEEKNLREATEDLLQTMSSSVKELNIIIIDDGSTDSTLQVAVQLSEEHKQVRVIRHMKRMGIGASYRDALKVAQGDYFTWFPADHENSAQEFALCIPYLREDVVVTCYHQRQDPRSYLRRFISRSYTYILNTIFSLDLKYYNGLTIFPISALRSLTLVSDGFLFTAENLIKAIKEGYRVVELPISLRGRLSGRSNALTLRSFQQMIKDIVCILQK